jgi:hypothetical protein
MAGISVIPGADGGICSPVRVAGREPGSRPHGGWHASGPTETPFVESTCTGDWMRGMRSWMLAAALVVLTPPAQ